MAFYVCRVRQKDLNALKRTVATMLLYYRKFTTSYRICGFLAQVRNTNLIRTLFFA
jgi:hypothetical protein